MNLLETKKNEYSLYVIHLLTPQILNGLNFLYEESKKLSNPESVLKMFQKLLKKIPEWNDNMLSQEVNRIMVSINDTNNLEDLIRAVVKSQIIILSYNPLSDVTPYIERSYYNDISIDKFIKNIYVNCAREFWIQPNLFYHNLESIKLQKNQKEILNIIKCCIDDAFRSLIPINFVLNNFLNTDMDYVTHQIKQQQKQQQTQVQQENNQNDLNNIDELIPYQQPSLNQQQQPLLNQQQQPLINQQQQPLINQQQPLINQQQQPGLQINEQNKDDYIKELLEKKDEEQKGGKKSSSSSSSTSSLSKKSKTSSSDTRRSRKQHSESSSTSSVMKGGDNSSMDTREQIMNIINKNNVSTVNKYSETSESTTYKKKYETSETYNAGNNNENCIEVFTNDVRREKNKNHKILSSYLNM